MKLTLSSVFWVIWAISLVLLFYLLIQNFMVPYDQINHNLDDMIKLIAIALMVIAVLGFFFSRVLTNRRNVKTKQTPS